MDASDMPETPSEEVDADHIVALAEEYLETHSTPTDPELKQVLTEKIETWEERLADVDEGDPLHHVISEELEEKRERLHRLEAQSNGVKREFMQAVADGYVAKGFWLDQSILEALNFVLFGKYGESIVIEKKIVEPDSTFSQEDLYDISMAVRQRARDELAMME
jgi:hypothetical protein